eukprot:5453340-Alexandrium_andersonii.AAC.1
MGTAQVALEAPGLLQDRLVRLSRPQHANHVGHGGVAQVDVEPAQRRVHRGAHGQHVCALCRQRAR